MPPFDPPKSGGRRVVVVGDALLDRDIHGTADRLCPDAPVPVVDSHGGRARPGGAALAAALAALDGRDVTLVTALADDQAGAELRRLLAAAGVEVLDCGLDGETPQKIRVHAGGQPLLRVDYGGAGGRCGPLPPSAAAAIETAAAVLVADYGRGITAEPSVRAALGRRAPRQPVAWDPHPRGADPVPSVRLVTPNRAELVRLEPGATEGSLRALTAAATALLRRWQAGAIAVTLGADGALLVGGDGTPLAVHAPAVDSSDTCGAGDRFAAAAAGALADGALPSEAVAAAVTAASAFVAAGAAGALDLDGSPQVPARRDQVRRAEGEAVIARVRECGGTVVATGGCFDLLHAGHVATLEAARALGQCLVVCLNSDDSVRRLKGPGRPLQTQADRAAVLRGLRCVDAVVVFDEDTPEAVLRRLRPDVWAKGADYAVADLPEAAALAEWDGQAVVLPFVPGRSTTLLIEEALRRADH